MFRKAKKPVLLFIDDAHNLHVKTLNSLKPLSELATDEERKVLIILIGHPKLKSDVRRPSMEEVGVRNSVQVWCITRSVAGSYRLNSVRNHQLKNEIYNFITD